MRRLGDRCWCPTFSDLRLFGGSADRAHCCCCCSAAPAGSTRVCPPAAARSGSERAGALATQSPDGTPCCVDPSLPHTGKPLSACAPVLPRWAMAACPMRRGSPLRHPSCTPPPPLCTPLRPPLCTQRSTLSRPHTNQHAALPPSGSAAALLPCRPWPTSPPQRYPAHLLPCRPWLTSPALSSAARRTGSRWPPAASTRALCPAAAAPPPPPPPRWQPRRDPAPGGSLAWSRGRASPTWWRVCCSTSLSWWSRRRGCCWRHARCVLRGVGRGVRSRWGWGLRAIDPAGTANRNPAPPVLLVQEGDATVGLAVCELLLGDPGSALQLLEEDERIAGGWWVGAGPCLLGVHLAPRPASVLSSVVGLGTAPL